VVTDDGVRLAVSVHGDGAPLLMIPGLGATRRVYAPIVPALARRHRVIVYDPRGVGDSDVPAGPYPMPRLAADCVAVAAAVGAESFLLFGASMGGLTAQHVAVLHPGRVERLVLAATGPGRHAATAPHPEAVAALLGRGARTPEEAYRMACTVLYSPRFQRLHPRFIDEEVAHRAAHPIPGRAFTAQYRSVREADIGRRLGEIAVPALVLHGTEDVLVPLADAETLIRLIPGARRYWFDGCGHLFFHEAPGLAADVILSFLTGGESPLAGGESPLAGGESPLAGGESPAAR
jgi:pimeloyl-ACP methyl ester carboxylesterase